MRGLDYPMGIERIIVYHVRLPLKISFRHARSTRRESESIVVEAVTNEGVSGFGEGAPREYVTGETADFALNYLSGLDYSFLSAGWRSLGEGLARLEDWETIETGGGTVFPGAARCALCISLLDGITRSYGTRISDIVQFARGYEKTPPARVRYSAVCSGGSVTSVAANLVAFRLYGFRSVKLKVGWGEERDVALVRLARRLLGRGVDIRVDANGIWDTRTALRIIPRFERFGVSSVEEPLSPEYADDLPGLRKGVRIPIMLDESACSLSQVRRAIERGACDMVNIRLSKCGGFFASLRLVRLLRESGIGYQLGCQVGESGILSAAGRHFSFIVPDLVHIEGSYDKHLLRENLTKEEPSFGFGGWARSIPGPGLGVTVDRDALERHTVNRFEIYLHGREKQHE